jgi:hypothetical protein
MRTALLLLIASALVAPFALPARADASVPASPANAQTAPTAPANESSPTDAELARKRLARCQLHPEICVQQDGKGERNKAKEKPDSDSAPQTQKPPPESVPR